MSLVKSASYHPKPSIQRWEHEQQEKARLRRLAEIRPVVQSGRPPRPLHPASLPSSRVPSVDGGSRPASQCSSPVLYKPRRRARSESPARRLAPIQHPAAPGAHALETERRSLPEAGSRIMCDAVGNVTHHSAPTEVGGSSEALSDLARQDRRSLPQAPSLDSLIGRKASPRLPPVAPRRQSTSSPSRAAPEHKDARGAKKSARGSRSNSKNRPVDAVKQSAAPRAQSRSRLPDVLQAPVNSQPPECGLMPGLQRETTADLLQAALQPEPEVEVQPIAPALREVPHQEDTSAESPAKKEVKDGANASDLNSAAAIEDWLAEAKKKLAAVCPQAPLDNNNGVSGGTADANIEPQDCPKDAGYGAASGFVGASSHVLNRSQEACRTAAVSEHCSMNSDMPEEVIISSMSGHMPVRSAETPSVAEESMQPGTQSAAASVHSGQAPSKSGGVPSIIEESMPPETQSVTVSAHERVTSDVQSATFGAQSAATGHGSICSEIDDNAHSQKSVVAADDVSERAASGALGLTNAHSTGRSSTNGKLSIQEEQIRDEQSEQPGATASSLRSGQSNLHATGNSDVPLASTSRSSRKDLGATNASYADDFEEYEADEDEDDEEDDD